MAVEVSLTVLTKSRTVSMVWLTVRLPSAAMVSTVLMSLSTPSTISRLVEVMVWACLVAPSAIRWVVVSTVRVTPSVIWVAVSVTEASTSLAAFLTLALPSVMPCARPAQVCIPISENTRDGEWMPSTFFTMSGSCWARP